MDLSSEFLQPIDISPCRPTQFMNNSRAALNFNSGRSQGVNMLEVGKIQWLEVEKDIRLRYFVSHAPKNPIGTLVILPGRASYIEKYESVVKPWIAKDYQVFIFEWRGQGQSSRISPDFPWVHVEDYASYQQDLEHWLLKCVIPWAETPLTFYAVSMGALIAGIFLATEHNISKKVAKAILVVPMFGLRTGRVPKVVVQRLTKSLCSLGCGRLPLPGYKKIAADVPEEFSTFPRGLTFAWLLASFKAIQTFQQPWLLDKISIPCLVIRAGKDTTVDNSGDEEICRMIKGCTVKTYPEIDHGIHYSSLATLEQLFQDCWSFATETPVLS